MNKTRSSFEKKFSTYLKKGFSLALTASLILGGFFVANFALAEHTATVTVSPTLVKGGDTGLYTFTIGNDIGSTDFIYKITITAPAGFTITGAPTCPSDWLSSTTTSVATCTGDADPGAGLGIAVGASDTMSFNATSPGSDSTDPWTVATKDNAFTTVVNNPVTTVDATVPTITSITTKDTNADGSADGSVDTATIILDEPIDDSTFSAGDFTLGGSLVTDINTGTTADDDTFDIVVSGGVAGTEAKEVIYSGTSIEDLVGNPLAGFTLISTDEASPVFLSAETMTITTIDLIFSEDLDGETVDSSGSEFSVDGHTVSGASETSAGIVTLTLSTTMGTGEIPNVTFTNTGTFTDLAGNEAVSPITRTPTDGIAPTFTAETLTITTIEITFSENVDSASDAAAQWAVAGNTVASVSTLDGSSSILTITVNTSLATDAIPDVTYTAGDIVDASPAANALATATVTPTDGIAPSVLSHEPTTNEVGVDPATDIVVTFDEAAFIEIGNVTFDPVISFTIENSGTETVTINPDSDLDDNTTYTIILSGVVDAAGNVMPDEEWSFTTSASYSLALTTGWNLISLPVVPATTTISDVLGTLDDDSKIESVFAYNAVTNVWTVYHPESPGTSDLSTMTAGYGYWIDYIASESGAIEGTGNLFLEGNNVPPQRTLANGWNLIGYYQLENTTSVKSRYALATLFDGANSEENKLWTQLRTYDNVGKAFEPAIGFEEDVDPGEGFWIFMNSSKIYGPGTKAF